MVQNLTESLIAKLKPGPKRYDVYDHKITGLCLRVEKTGTKTWYLCYKDPVNTARHMKPLGKQCHLTLEQAREIAKDEISQMRITKQDTLALAAKKIEKRVTVGDIVQLYIKWLPKNRKSVRQTIGMLNSFQTLYEIIAEELSSEDVEAWRRSVEHLNYRTVNRRLALLQSMLTWSVTEKHIGKNPIKGAVKLTRKKTLSEEDVTDTGNDDHDNKDYFEEDGKRVRYLSPDERTALLTALEKRDEKKRDYLKCAVLLSLNTGVRLGTLLRLRWKYINFDRATLHLPDRIMKSGKNKNIPINSVALDALREWKKRLKPKKLTGFVFPGKKPGHHLKDPKNAWRKLKKIAGLIDFTWHDMRHDFASQLAMLGVPIYTIQRLMCHESANMTERYAHLAPKHLQDTTEELNFLFKK